MKSLNLILVNEKTKALLFKLTALLTFLALNFIGYNAFSMETSQISHFETSAHRNKTSQEWSSHQIPTCQIASEGMVENKWNSIRIKISGALVTGADTLSDLSQKLKNLVVEGKCLPDPANCSLATEGLAMGSWVKHRILIQDVIAFGADTTARIFDQLGELKKIGLCE